MLESGQLFEFNRTKMHPFGRSVTLTQDSKGQYIPHMIVGNVGITFPSDVFEKGARKIDKFMKSPDGKEAQDRRRATLGFTVQCDPDPKKQRRKPDVD